VALHPSDAERAQEGGADRLQVCTWVEGEPHSMEPAAVSALVRSTDLPVRVTLRLSGGFSTQGGEFTRLVGLAGDYLALGVEGFSFGFLTRDLDVDTALCMELATQIGGAPWTFDRAFDHTLDLRRSWRRAAQLPGLDAVHSAGAANGLEAGFDELLAIADASPDFARTVIAAGGTQPEHVPWLVRAGITRIHLGAAVRPGGSWDKAHVDPGFVRAWRLLLDSTAGIDARTGEAG
jgi:copper homeostasis protein